jgi:hypothetical protein
MDEGGAAPKNQNSSHYFVVSQEAFRLVSLLGLVGRAVMYPILHLLLLCQLNVSSFAAMHLEQLWDVKVHLEFRLLLVVC